MLKSANLLHKRGLDDSQLHTTAVHCKSVISMSFFVCFDFSGCSVTNKNIYAALYPRILFWLRYDVLNNINLSYLITYSVSVDYEGVNSINLSPTLPFLRLSPSQVSLWEGLWL